MSVVGSTFSKRTPYHFAPGDLSLISNLPGHYNEKLEYNL